MNITKVIAFFLSSFLLAGCAGYQVGSTLPSEIQTVFVQVENQTAEPSVEVDVMKALRAEVQVDGRLTLSTKKDADVILNVTLSQYDITPLSYDRDHGTLAREYRVRLIGSSVLSNSETGDVIVESPMIRGDIDFPYATDLTSAKRGALPGASSDLARKVVSLITTAW